MIQPSSPITKSACYHCGENCNEPVMAGEKTFCCNGCRMVFEIINDNGLCAYYEMESNPGINRRINVRPDKFAILDNTDVAAKLIHFSEGRNKHVIFYLPQMHCSSCIWLIENLSKLNPGILRSTVDFPKKEVTIIFNPEIAGLKTIAELLTSVGYEPHISLNDIDNSRLKKYSRSTIYKIGIAGFCFGNIMMLSFPEYFASGDLQDNLGRIFSFINLGLSLPVFFYCASGFFSSAWAGLKNKFLNIDAPIALAVLIAFARSIYEITTFTGAGYLDSMCGIVFFMLIGRYFQDRTYQSLTFNRDYTSYFPIGVTVVSDDGSEKQLTAAQLKKGHRIRIHSQEIVPADSILFLGQARIDYSFVTGETEPVEKVIGEIVYAGGKQTGATIELEVVKEVSQSYLTQLWNNDVFRKDVPAKKVSFVHSVSRYFTLVLFSIAAITAVYWWVNDTDRILNAVTAILIVACPCALLLSATFTNGNMLSHLQKAGLYLKNAGVLEEISTANMLVFDKTGTLSTTHNAEIKFNGELDDKSKMLIRSLASQSLHPLSKIITSYLEGIKKSTVSDFTEEKGQGSSGLINGDLVKLGSEQFITGKKTHDSNSGSRIYVSVNGELTGYFSISTGYRSGLHQLVQRLSGNYKLAILSGDNNSEAAALKKIFGQNTEMTFDQNPQQKLNYIKQLQLAGNRVIMIGDGLNDAGALRQSNVGIAVTDDINNFSPGCDAIIEGRHLSKLAAFIEYCSKEKSVIYGSFIISILYNIIGLYYAVQGQLSPVVAAILMPVSSVSIMLFTTILTTYFAPKTETDKNQF